MTSRSRLVRWSRRAAVIVVIAIGLGAFDAVVLYRNIDRIPFRSHGHQPGTTFLILGSDSRAFVDDPRDRNRFGAVPGARADVVLVAHLPEGDAPPTLVAVPRDLLVFTESGIPRRLNVTMLGRGPQGTADAMCRSLGIAVDHVAMIGLDGFERLVDSVGGIDVTVEVPFRDRFTGLDLATAGEQRLDGVQALAYVRSRHPEVRAGDTWLPPADGAGNRPDQAGAVVRSLGRRVLGSAANPFVAHRAAWTLSSAVSVDSSMSPNDMLELAEAMAELRGGNRFQVLPATTHDAGVPIAEIGAGADAVLRSLGAGGSTGPCRPTLLQAHRASRAVDAVDLGGDGQ